MIKDQVMPRLNANDVEVEVLRVHLKDMTPAQKGQPLMDVETSKATVEIPCEHDGIARVRCKAGQVVRVGAVIAQYSTDGTFDDAGSVAEQAATPAVTPATGTQPADGVLPPATAGFARFSRPAREALAARGIDPQRFSGCGFITSRVLDGERRKRQVPGATAPHAAPPADLPPNLELSAFAGCKNDPVGKGKRLEIALLTGGQAGNINSSITVQFLSAKLRASLAQRKRLEGHVLPLVLFEFARLLEENPPFNAFFEDDRIWYHGQVNLGIALDMGKGLKVPVIADANRLWPAEILDKLNRYSMTYLESKLSPEDLQGGTVTVTDLSGENVLFFQPLLNYRQSIILGIGGDAEAPGFPMSFTIVFDHRVLSGRQVSAFLNQLKARVASYESI